MRKLKIDEVRPPQSRDSCARLRHRRTATPRSWLPAGRITAAEKKAEGLAD